MDLPGIGPAGAARILADVGDVARFPEPGALRVLARHRLDRCLLRRTGPAPVVPGRQPPDQPSPAHRRRCCSCETTPTGGPTSAASAPKARAAWRPCAASLGEYRDRGPAGGWAAVSRSCLGMASLPSRYDGQFEYGHPGRAEAPRPALGTCPTEGRTMRNRHRASTPWSQPPTLRRGRRGELRRLGLGQRQPSRHVIDAAGGIVDRWS
jgi:hypothetical protein